MKKSDPLNVEQMTITPEMAVAMLEANKHNRPLNDTHVKRLSRQIIEGKWVMNGDSIKFADSGDVLDGQHRLWAIIYAKTPVPTLVVRGVKANAFATIDTLRKPRSASDMLHLCGLEKYRTVAAAGLAWQIRYERDVLEAWKEPQNRVENSDIEEAYTRHPMIANAADRATALRYVYNPSLLSFLYYAMAQQNEPVAERMMATLGDATGTAVDDPFFLLRTYMVTRTKQAKDPLMTIAMTFKAANAAYRRRKLTALIWRRQGAVPEPFPILEIKE